MSGNYPVANHSGEIRRYRNGEESAILGFAESVKSASRLVMARLPGQSLSLINKFGFKLSVDLISSDAVGNTCGEPYYRYCIGK
jgi:hypothetical protein